nr:LETM1 domain-containing protein 1-like [Pocillopora verrucosa]
MATSNVGRLQCLYSHVSNYRQYHGLQQGTFVYLRFTGIIYNRNDGFQKNFSTSPRNAARSADLSRYQKFRKVINTFVAGSKQLGKDVKVMFQIQRKLKSNNYNWEVLKTEEILHLHQTRKDLLKSLPVVVGFFIPFLGYAVPFVAFLYPKQLLSHHYWQPHQREKFAQQDVRRRRKYQLPLVREVGRLALRYKASRYSTDLMSTSVKAVNKKHLSNEELLQMAEFFEGNLLGFDHLPRYHLKKLSQVWLITPWLPKSFLRIRLKRLVKSIKREDAAIKKEGLVNLQEDQLKVVCHSRGLDTTDVDPEALVQWLAEWVELSDAAGDTDESFLAHCAVFKAMNYSKDGKAGDQDLVVQKG